MATRGYSAPFTVTGRKKSSSGLYARQPMRHRPTGRASAAIFGWKPTTREQIALCDHVLHEAKKKHTLGVLG